MENIRRDFILNEWVKTLKTPNKNNKPATLKCMQTHAYADNCIFKGLTIQQQQNQ